MWEIIYWFSVGVRLIFLAAITFYVYKSTNFFLSRSTFYHLSPFEVLKKKLYMTGIGFAVAAVILFSPETYPELWAKKTNDTSKQPITNTVQINEPIRPVIETAPIPVPITTNQKSTENVKPQIKNIEEENVEVIADHQLYDEHPQKNEIVPSTLNLPQPDIEPVKPVLIMGH